MKWTENDVFKIKNCQKWSFLEISIGWERVLLNFHSMETLLMRLDYWLENNDFDNLRIRYIFVAG